VTVSATLVPAFQSKVLVTRHWPEAVEARLTASFDVTLRPDDRPMSADELRAALCSHDCVMPTVTDALTADVLGVQGRRARLVASVGVGFNHVDLDAARRAGLVVTNTPEVLTDCTADLAMTLLLMVARRAGEGERLVRAGDWSGWRPTQLLGTRITGKTLGLVGFGRIARAVARRAHHGFGMRVLYVDPVPAPADVAANVGATACASLDELLSRADFVSLHCPGGAANRHLVDAARLAAMKPTAFLINSARGDVVDEAALVAALERRTIAGAALDVFEGEPRVHPGLVSRDDVVLLPHLGSATQETRVAMGMRAIDNVAAFFEGRRPPDALT
jgi:lactate dehydrogenase-like 2-hydroxyacid dehydrogenase